MFQEFTIIGGLGLTHPVRGRSAILQRDPASITGKAGEMSGMPLTLSFME